jgi:demethylmacrocin O-methyltransferase
MYTSHYERHLRSRRAQPLRILEIGIGGYSEGTGGSSLRMWRTYFPRARVFGIDIEPRDLREPRIRTFCGSQSDRAFLARVVAAIGAPDVVIDDGSHRSVDIITSFETLFPHLAPGGLYVIEDLHCSYNPDYGGGPPGSARTTVELVKQLVDRVARRRPGVDETAAIHVYPRIVFIQKR